MADTLIGLTALHGELANEAHRSVAAARGRRAFISLIFTNRHSALTHFPHGLGRPRQLTGGLGREGSARLASYLLMVP